MATLVLATAGAAIGAGFGGTVLGLSGAVIGRALGATLGRAIDQRLLGGSQAVESGRIDRLRLTGAGEGAPIRRLWGRMRIAGQVIWAAPLVEHSTTRRRGGKGGGPKVTEYGYSVSLAIGLCEGEILGLGRIWADGEEIEPDGITMRLYPGSEDQLPDARIEAVEGPGMVPGFRGLAYVVFEDLDLAPWGNRVPQFTFEVIRAAQGPDPDEEAPTLDRAVRAVALIPGTGEYALATTPVTLNRGLGRTETVNRHVLSAPTDLAASLGQLFTELPRVGSVSLVVSWFGDDLRCNHCTIRPRVEQKDADGVEMPWRAGGIDRAAAGEVPRVEGRSIYGGTPADASVIEAIRAIRAEGREVMFYPFVLMEQLAGNMLPDPWTGTSGQPALPWRGRITTELAPGRPGTSDRTAAAAAEVAAFFGAAQPGDFAVTGEGRVDYSGPAEWGLRRFILHYAHLCAAAGGVDAFCIGSELRGLTRIRGAGDGFPAVAALRALAADVRAILGPGCRITYAADWSEYGSHVVDGNVHFPLDPLWADENIDFVGIDNYMPLSDWRDGPDHADAHWESPCSLAYLAANVAGGEGFDWFYDSLEGEAAQRRLPITDGAHDEPWIYRVKDLRAWWSRPHHERAGGLRLPGPTAWVPMSKPIVFTEYGCAAIDKGANQPNLFVDARSSESALPRASNGRRDDLMQMQYLRAMAVYWGDAANNPVSPLYGGRMVDMARAHVWAWDARPFPAFPAREDLWSDGPALLRGHWLNGRATNQPLSAVIREVAATAGVATDTARCYGLVRGYVQDRVQEARATLQPLLLASAVDAAERDGRLVFRSRMAGVDGGIAPGDLALGAGLDGLAEHVRAAEGETGRIVRVDHVDAEGVYDACTSEARHPDIAAQGVAATEIPLALTRGEGRAIAQRWLAETGIARDTLRLALPPSRLDLGPGDRIALADGSTWRVDRAELADVLTLEAVRVEGGVYDAGDSSGELPAVRPFLAPVAPVVRFLDLPLLTGAEVPHAPHVAVAAHPWQGPMAVWSDAGTGFALDRLVTRAAVIGETESPLFAHPPGLWDRGPALRVRLVPGGALAGADEGAVLNGANAMAIGDGTSDFWEVFQFRDADLVAPDTWDLSHRLRGQLGSDGVMPAVWPAGSTVVLLGRAPVQIGLDANARGLVRRYRIGLNARGHDRPEVVEITAAFQGIGLRPWPVAHLAATRAGGDVELRWIRRTRIEGDGWQQFEVPLGEESEAYLVCISAGGDLRREATCGGPSFLYSAAMRAQDGAGAGFTAEVAQLSARFGPGPFRRLAVTA